MSLNVSRPLKIVIVGDSHVGKTNIFDVFDGNLFNVDACPTIGVNNLESSINIDGTRVPLTICDTPSLDELNDLSSFNISDCDGCILVYNVENKKSFENVKRMHHFISTNILTDNSHFPFLLLGNKCDLSHKEVDALEAREFARNNESMLFFEVSAKTCEKIEESFEHFILRILFQRKERTIAEPETQHKKKSWFMKSKKNEESSPDQDQMISLLNHHFDEQRRESSIQREKIDSLVSICHKQSKKICQLMEFNQNLERQNEAFQEETKNELSSLHKEMRDDYHSILYIINDSGSFLTDNKDGSTS